MVWIAATLVVCAVAAQSGKRNLLAVAIVLSLVTPVLALAIYLILPDYLKPLTEDFCGIMGLIVAGILTVAGWFWLQRIVDIEV